MGKIGIGVDIFDDLVFNFNLCYSINWYYKCTNFYVLSDFVGITRTGRPWY